MKNYYLDRKIISMLFKITDEELLNETESLFMDILFKLNENLSREFLTNKGVTEPEIQEFFKSEYPQNEKIKSILASEEYMKTLKDNRDSMLAKFYDEYLPKLSETEKKELEEYIQILGEDEKNNLDNMNLLAGFFQVKDELIGENRITQEDFTNAVEKALENLTTNAEPTEQSSHQSVDNPPPPPST